MSGNEGLKKKRRGEDEERCYEDLFGILEGLESREIRE